MKTHLAVSFAVILSLSCSSTDNDQPAPVPTKQFTLAREQSLGSSNENDYFKSPSAVVVRPDGTTYIADGALKKFLVYDSTGKFLKAIGRPGKGPGEYNMIARAGLSGDTLWAYDPSTSRITFLTANGQASTLELPKERGGGPARIDWRLADGSYIQTAQPDLSGIAQLAAHPEAPSNTAIVRVHPGGDKEDTLSRVACKPSLILIAMAGTDIASIDVFRTPFADCDLSTVNQDGKAAYVITGNTPRTIDSSTIVVTQLDGQGMKKWEQRIPYKPRPIPQAFLDSVARANATNPDTKKFDQKQGSLLRKALSYHTFFAPVSAAVAGIDGTLFLAREIGDPSTTWVVISPHGKITGSFSLPGDSKVLSGDATRIWVAEVDESDAVRVNRYRLQ
jgi:hypothetical protein